MEQIAFKVHHIYFIGIFRQPPTVCFTGSAHPDTLKASTPWSNLGPDPVGKGKKNSDLALPNQKINEASITPPLPNSRTYGLRLVGNGVQTSPFAQNLQQSGHSIYIMQQSYHPRMLNYYSIAKGRRCLLSDDQARTLRNDKATGLRSNELQKRHQSLHIASLT